MVTYSTRFISRRGMLPGPPERGHREGHARVGSAHDDERPSSRSSRRRSRSRPLGRWAARPRGRPSINRRVVHSVVPAGDGRLERHRSRRRASAHCGPGVPPLLPPGPLSALGPPLEPLSRRCRRRRRRRRLSRSRARTRPSAHARSYSREDLCRGCAVTDEIDEVLDVIQIRRVDPTIGPRS